MIDQRRYQLAFDDVAERQEGGRSKVKQNSFTD